MKSNEEQVRDAIAEQAAEWFVANDEGPLDVHDAAALAAWLKTSPQHIEEFLGVSTIARDLKQSRTDPQYSLEAILARARAEEDRVAQPIRPGAIRPGAITPGAIDADPRRGGPPRPDRRPTARRWIPVAATLAACTVLSLTLLMTRTVSPAKHPPSTVRVTALHFATRHGEQLTQRLADNSVLHLDTDSAVTLRYSERARLVTLTSGRAAFEVAHESARPFRVLAGAAEIVDLGTQFDVRVDSNSTVVTVFQGRVTAGPSPISPTLTFSNPNRAPRVVELGANQRLRVVQGEWPATPVSVDAQSATAWLRREMVFDHEPLERVAAEYNRYAPTPIEIATPALRNLLISGVFSNDDPDAFIAFLRSLKGVRVEVAATRIRVWSAGGAAPRT